MKRDSLSPGKIYIESLEEVLGIRLDNDSLKGKVRRKQIESIAEHVRTLSLALTKQGEAPLEHRYLARKEFQQAYQLYYTTTNFLKVIPPLRELQLGGFAEKDELHVLDLGTGTGAAIWGLVQFLETDHAKPIKLTVTAVDSVGENLQFVRTFARAVAKRCTYVTLSVETKQTDLESVSDRTFGTGAFDLVLMMNTLNELNESARASMRTILPKAITTDGNIILIEPASKSHSRSLLELRDQMVADGLTIFAPCTRQQTCPALVSEDNWCHGDYRWDRPRFAAMIDEHIGLVRLSLKSSYFTINKRGSTLPSVLAKSNGSYRVVSERFDEKGRVRAICCGTDGRGEFILNKRDKSLDNKQFMYVERYDLIQLSGVLAREHDTVISEASIAIQVLQSTGAR